MKNTAKQGTPDLLSGAVSLVSKWGFCTISAKKSPEKFFGLVLHKNALSRGLCKAAHSLLFSLLVLAMFRCQTYGNTQTHAWPQRINVMVAHHPLKRAAWQQPGSALISLQSSWLCGNEIARMLCKRTRAGALCPGSFALAHLRRQRAYHASVTRT